MDMNQSSNFRSSNSNFMQMGSLMLPYPPQITNQDTEESSESQFKRLQKHNLQLFWNQQSYEMHNGSVTKSQNQLPLARIKRIMKSDGDVKMISSETPILFSKACELFIMELTLRSWLQTEGCKRRTLQRNDIARAIRNDDLLDFLVDVVPLDGDDDDDDSQKEEEVGKNATTTSAGNVDQARPDDHESLNHPQTNFGAEMVNPMVQEVPQQFMYDPSMASAFQFKFPPSEQN